MADATVEKRSSSIKKGSSSISIPKGQNNVTVGESKKSRSRSESKTSITSNSSTSSEEIIASRPRHGLKSLYWKVPPKDIPSNLENKRWHRLSLDLARLNKEESAVFFDNSGKSIDVKPITEPEKAYDFVLSRYVKYCLIANKLDNCYGFLVHPQKRLLLKTCISAVFTRILELKNELVQIDQREYHFFDSVLQSFQHTHDEIELRIPLFIREERAQVLKNRERILSLLYDKYSTLNPIVVQQEQKAMTRAEAILLIQRQTRYYLGMVKSEMAHQVIRAKSAELAQKLQQSTINKWIVKATRNHTFSHKNALDQLLQMIPEDNVGSGQSVIDFMSSRNKAKAKEKEAEFEADKALVESELYESEGPHMAWTLYYNIKQWLLEARDILGKFPPYPEAEDGGSLVLFSDKSIREVAQDLDTFVVNGKVTIVKEKKKKRAKKEKKIPKKNPWGPNGFEYIIDETECMREMKTCSREYCDYWYFKDDSRNFDQAHDRELLKEHTRFQVAEQIRLEVDELIRAELENLTYAIDRQPRVDSKKAKKKDKKKKDKQKQKKENKDLTADKTIEELFESLVSQGIIQYSPKATLRDFLGDHCFSGAELDLAKKDPLPALADVRRMITAFAVLPLSSNSIHENAPLIRKLLIAGVRGTGKKLLLRAICHETGANLFDLSPKNLEGKFDSPQGKKMLMHLILKVGKALEPTVFWIGDCEKMFLKKRDKTDTSKPHQWVNILNKTLKKGIKNGDRMMLIGTTSMPELTKQKKFNKFFDRIIMVPYPNYSTRYLAWKHFISNNTHAPVPPYFNLSLLSKVSEGYTIDAIKDTCAKVLTKELQAKFKYRPMCVEDFIHAISKRDPVYTEEQEQFLAWYNNTPLAKQRQQRIHAE
ncbi:Iq and aaa domain-containing protein 1 [Plakobranchus ocellatus]|uniref:Iq and aaa domain-containing protein 1 n=1 Tax=Plakobranchus ocellatus TaxID=259542 RepID=A0AAV4CYQ3_9GAST|nr:Iq and aaa domain-containing protein 1 [Plakobranchus ocellatus]